MNTFPVRSLFGMLTLTVFFAVLILLIGDTPFSILWAGVLSRWHEGSSGWNALLDERLPRLIVILCTGSSLAVSGAVTQSLFRNPLASPSVLGITFGGSLCVVFTFMAGWNVTHPFSVPIAAFSGCTLTLFAVYTFSKREGRVDMTHLVLNGIAITTVLLALQRILLYTMRDQWHLIQALTEWEAGSTADRTWLHVHMQLPLTIVGLVGCWWYTQELDILALGEEEAVNLGLEVEQIRWRLFLCVALLTGGAIAAVGIIAFFGLLLPHLFRKIYGPVNRHLVPLCLVGGAGLLAGLEVFLRVTHTHLFTIGNISALLGGGFFLILLLGERKQQAVVV